MQYTGARILIESLIEQGVDTVFGYPGSAVLHIYDELFRHEDRIRHILVSHEQHAAHAADGYARSTGRPGVCIATSGPGAANLITGIASAYMDSVPLVAITGNVPTSLLGKDSFQEVDIAGISMPIVKHNWIIKNIDELAPTIREAFFVAQNGRPGSVLIDIPKDITALKTIWTPEKTHDNSYSPRTQRLMTKYRKKSFADEDIERALHLIGKSERPLIYAGGGVISAGAELELTDLMERLNSPCAVSLMGIGAVPHNHWLYTGLIGMHGSIASNTLAQKADLLIAVGARFSDRVICKEDMFAETAKVIHFDIDPAEVNKNIETETWVTGNLKDTLKALLKKIPRRKENYWNKELNELKKKSHSNITKEQINRAEFIEPGFIIKETAKKLGENAIAVTDVGQHQIWAAQNFPALKPRTFISSGGLGTMGFGMGAAIGAKTANPGEPVVLFTGDGCFRMNSGELATLKTHKIPILIIVFNNGVLGMVRQWQSYFYKGHHSQSSLDIYPDYIKLCEAYSVTAFKAENNTSFLEVLDLAMERLAAGEPVLIDAKIDPDEKVLPMVPSGKPLDEQILS